jgi:hypothetical protein
VPLAVLLFLAAAFLLRRRTNPYAMAAIGVTLAPLPALFARFRAARAMVDRFHEISAGEPSAMATATARALTAANDTVSRAQLATAAIVAAVVLLSLFALSRKPQGATEGPSSRSRLVSGAAIVALVSSVVVCELGTDAVLFPLAVVASQQGGPDPALPLTNEAAKALFMDAGSQDAVSGKVGEYLAATTLGSFLAMAYCIAGFVVTLLTSSGASFPRSTALAGLLLALLLAAATAREIARHRAIGGELAMIASKIEAPAPPGGGAK